MKNKKDIYVLLNNIRSLHNVGSIFRTSDGAGVKKIFLTGQTGYPPREEISKTALGAEECVPWEYYIDPVDCVKKLKKKGIRIVALEVAKNSIDYKKYKPSYPICLVVGHEISGVSEDLLSFCDDVIEIPMRGKKESLNVSVAFGIGIYSLASYS
jgi:tRNA G18 (ribose-2'-O)-methylase SpoU